MWKGLTSPTSLCCALMFGLDNIAVQGIAVFLPSIVRNIFPAPRYTVIDQQLLSVPPNIMGAVFCLAFAYFSARTRRSAAFVIAGTIIMVVGYSMFLGSKDLYVRYGACFIATSGAFSPGAVVTAWAAANANNDSERAGAIAAVMLFGNLCGLVSTWSYLSKHAPNYVPGNSLNLANGMVVGITAIILASWQSRENKQRDAGKRDHRLEGLSEEEVALLGSSHPHFRFRY